MEITQGIGGTDVERAAREYEARRVRRSHPKGKTDNGGRWYPAESERCPCCNRGRSPSRAWPWSLMTHCRTALHVANLYGVKKADLLKEARKLR